MMIFLSDIFTDKGGVSGVDDPAYLLRVSKKRHESFPVALP